MSREIEEKTERLVGMLEREKLGGVLLNGQHNFAWITGGANNGIDRSRENGAASVLVTSKGRRYLLANNIEMPRMLEEEVSPELFEPFEFAWQDEKASGTFLTDAAIRIAGGDMATDIALNASVRAVDGLIAECRHSFTDEEVARYRMLARDACSAIDSLVDRLRPRMTELAIAAMMRHELASWLIESVVTLVAIDQRISRFRHPVPTRKGLGEMILIVTCAKRNGLIVSLSRVVTRGQTSSELKEKTEAAAFVNAKLLAATRPGATGADLYQVAKGAYDEAGFPGEIDKHHQGGATGYRTRDWVAHPTSGDIVKLDQAFAWNPSVTGTKVEETVIVTDEGVETLTTSGKFPTLTHSIDGREYRSPGVLSIPI
jgi:Xaa-Pro aminopeptidase